MLIGQHDADSKHLNRGQHRKLFPNYALMKISAYHAERNKYLCIG